jgi:hypothetical protein
MTHQSEHGGGPQAFLPSVHGFVFDNAWPSQPAVVVRTPLGSLDLGNAAAGLCGGMAFAALDFWHAGVVPPQVRPAQGDPLFSFLVRRLVDSWHVPAGVAQYYQWMNLPDTDTTYEVLGRRLLDEHGLAWRTVVQQWPQVQAGIDSGAPVPLGVVTVRSRKPQDLSLNHQVLAYGYDVSGAQVTLHVYDPNRGPRDDVTVTFRTDAPATDAGLVSTLGLSRPVRGFFRTAYSAAAPPV